MGERKLIYFYPEKDTLVEGKYIVVFRITIYREKLGKHPDFLKSFGDEKHRKDGFSTKFWFLAKDENGNELVELSKEEATNISNVMNEKYVDMLYRCEDTGDWDEFPFKNCEIIYHK